MMNSPLGGFEKVPGLSFEIVILLAIFMSPSLIGFGIPANKLYAAHTKIMMQTLMVYLQYSFIYQIVWQLDRFLAIIIGPHH